MDPEDEYDVVWDEIQDLFGLNRQISNGTEKLSSPSKDFLLRENLLHGTLEYLEEQLAYKLRRDVVPAFWSRCMASTENADLTVNQDNRNKTRANDFSAAVTELYVQVVSQVVPMVNRMDGMAGDLGVKVYLHGQHSYMGYFKLLLKATLHSQLPADFCVPVEEFYTNAFHAFHTKQQELSLDDSNDTGAGEVIEGCDGCGKDAGCECGLLMSAFHDANRKLAEMDVLDRLTCDVVTKVVKAKITAHVKETCQGSYTISHLTPLEDWLDDVVMRWIRMVYCPATSSSDQEATQMLKSFRQRLCHFLYETYTRTRIEQLFNIIIEFPESQPALEDVRECLTKTDLRPVLTRNLKSVLEVKLLRVGVNTADILTAYIAAIRALRVLDPSGVLLELVCEPVSRYLRSREDTVRCIVSSLMSDDDNSSELAEELTKNEGLCLDESIFNEVGDDYDADELENNWETWNPDPIDASATTNAVSRRRRSSDIISMLVNIYGSKELFVNEYRSLLSNRLLSAFSYETEKEIRNLELLKLRFGEAPLHQCEVMLKDVGDSKRINTALHAEKPPEAAATSATENDESNDQETEGAENKVPVESSSAKTQGKVDLRSRAFPVQALILSAQFWPQFKNETLRLPDEVQESLDAFTKAFEAMKGNRTLSWKPHLGFANIDLEMGDRKINLTVSPVHAAIIYQFTEQAEWSADQLAASLKMPLATLRRKIGFWQAQGLIRETEGGSSYLLVEESPMRRLSESGGGVGVGASAAAEDDDNESATRTSSDQRAEELQVFWSYIVNMLINLESLPLERIFQMLKMFAIGGSAQGSAVECKIEALGAFLDEKVRQHELVFSGGQYKLPKQ